MDIIYPEKRAGLFEKLIEGNSGEASIEHRMVKTMDMSHDKVMSNDVSSQTRRWWMIICQYIWWVNDCCSKVLYME